MSKVIFLVDCDNFFVSCERLFRPDLRLFPVVVLSSNDGCVISRSEEVKKLGIAMGSPYFKVRSLCHENNVSVFSSNFALYRDISARVMDVLTEFSDDIEQYSIDEAFFTTRSDSETKIVEYAKKVCDAVYKNVGVPVSVGVSYTKTLAKVATHFAKTRHGGLGHFVLLQNEDVERCLKKLDVGDLWGIGRRLSPKLKKLQVNTAFDLFGRPSSWVNACLGLHGVRTHLELHGIEQYAVEGVPIIRSSLLRSQSFGAVLRNFADIEKMVAHHARTVAETLRSEGLLACEVGVFLYMQDRCGGRRHKRELRVEVLEVCENSTLVLVRVAIKILTHMYICGEKYIKAGVFVRDIVPGGFRSQQTLFGESCADTNLMNTIDVLRDRFGDVVKVASEVGHSVGEARSRHRSPLYTTKWSDVPVI